MFLSLNAGYMKPLLYPLLDSQSSESSALPYAASDLGETVSKKTLEIVLYSSSMAQALSIL